MFFKKLKLSFTNKLKVKKNNTIQIEKRAKVKYNVIQLKGSNNKIFISNDSIIKNCVIDIKGSNNNLYINSGNVSKVKIQIAGNGGKLSLGKNTNIKDSVLNIFSLEAGEISIGENTNFISVVIDCFENGNKVIIGENCMFSYGIEIRNTDSHPIYDSNGSLINEGKEIIIKDRVWVGTGVTILKGCIIEEGCIIGAKSLVSKSILKPKSIAAGIPAKILRENITWKREFN